MNKRLHRPHTYLQLIGHLLIRERDLVVDRIQEGFQRFEYGGLSLRGIFPSELRHRFIEQRQCPSCIEDLLCSQAIERCKLRPILCLLGIERHKVDLSASLQAVRMVHLIEDIILERSSQERTELTPDRAHLSQRFVAEKMQEKPLRQILCFVCIEAPTPHKQVDRLPIDPADLRKGILGTRRLALRRQEDRAPTGGAKSSSGVCWRWRLWLQSDLFRFPKLSDTPDFKNRFYTLQPASSQIPTQHFQERLKLRAGITVLVTRTHLTSLVRQLWVAFWGEQQAVVGTRRDGLYFCPQDPNPFVTRHLLP
jgi:hypothetical protein